MKPISGHTLRLVCSVLCLLTASVVCLATGQDKFRAESTPQRDNPAQPSPMKSSKISGLFDVKMTPASGPDAPVGRFTLDKKYHGELTATATGEMLAAMTAVKGSAGYVAIEKVTGQLAGRSGTFHLQHTGIMNRGTPSLTITVIPDSGTGELTGLTGTMAIKIAPDSAHGYEFEYALPDKS